MRLFLLLTMGTGECREGILPARPGGGESGPQGDEKALALGRKLDIIDALTCPSPDVNYLNLFSLFSILR